MRPRWRGLGPAVALSVSALVASSTSGSFAKSLLEAGWSVGAVTLLRMGLATIVLAPFAGWLLLTRRARLRGSLRGVLAVGTLGATGTTVCYFNAVALLPVGIAMMGLYTSPVMVLLWVWLRHGRRPDLWTVAGAVVAIGGVVLVVLTMGVGTPSPRGMAWALGGAVCLASFFISAAQVRADAPATVVAGAGLLVATATIAVLGMLGLVSLRTGRATVELASTSVSVVIPVALLALVPTAYTYVASMKSVKVLGARLASFLGLIELLAAVLLAWILLGEQPTARQMAGAALVIAGVTLIRSEQVDQITSTTGG